MIVVILILLLPVLAGCSSSDFSPQEENFPLTKSRTIASNEEIQKIGATDLFVVFESDGQLEAAETDSGKILWTIDNFWTEAESEILFTDTLTIVMSYDEILMVDRQGHRMFLNLNDKHRDLISLVAVHANYLYVINSAWVLEVYDISANKMIWETFTSRGGTSVYYEPSTDVTYVVESSSLRAFNSSAGNLLWEQSIGVSKSVYKDGILYIVNSEFRSNRYTIAAFDVVARKFVWLKEFYVKSQLDINDLSIFQDNLVIAAHYDFLAFDISDGVSKWQSSVNDTFKTKPVLLGHTLYAKGSSRKVYAISLENGKTEGYIQLEAGSFFAEPVYEAESGVYLIENGIAFKTKKSIELYTSE